MSILIRGGTVVDRDGERRADVAIGDDGLIERVGEGEGSADLVLDAAGAVVMPGLVDLHTHLREPGGERAETVETGSRAAALGGFTAVMAMPNTTPAIDSAAVVRDVQALGRTALCEVLVSGAITVGREGSRLTPMAEMAALGVRLFTDDGRGVQDDRLMRRALEYASGLGVVLAQHCENEALSAGGVMHEGAVSARLGLPGQPAEAEDLMVLRDVALARLTGGRVHFMHVSTQGAVGIIRAARADGLAVTAEVTTHHLTLTDEACSGFDPTFKVHPPLRTPADVAAVRAGLRDGTIDAVATDHAPHAPETKDQPFADAPPGMLGLETALALLLTEVELDWPTIVDRCCDRPAQIAGVADRHGGPVRAGRPANLCVVDPEHRWTVDPTRLASRSRNTPYAGHKLRGKVRHTICAGEAVVVDGSALR